MVGNSGMDTEQAAMLQRVRDTHEYNTHSAQSKIALSARD